jgi:pyruvate dehydrogenase E2 component (dihydrolipoamide acetyltransferase)
VRDLGERGRRRRLVPDDFADGTFTITNVGRYGTLVSGPIINHPQVAILSTDGVKPRPVALPDRDQGYLITVHPVGNLSLSFDHRAIDGAYASAFLARVRDTLETRDWEAEL